MLSLSLYLSLSFGYLTVGYTTRDVIYRWNSNRTVAIATDMKMSQFDLISTPAGNSTDKMKSGNIMQSIYLQHDLSLSASLSTTVQLSPSRISLSLLRYIVSTLYMLPVSQFHTCDYLQLSQPLRDLVFIAKLN